MAPLSSRPLSAFSALLVLLSACEPEPCAKDKVLDEKDIPCECEGVVVESLDCGGVTCTPYGPYASTATDTGCASSPSEETTSSR